MRSMIGIAVLWAFVAVALAQDADSYVQSGSAKFAARDYEGAIVDLTKAIEIDPRDARAYCMRGEAKHRKRDFDGAIADCSRAIEVEPRDYYLYGVRGQTKFDKGDFDGAIADFTKSIELDPLDHAPYRDRGEAKAAKGDRDGAILDYSKAIELDPRSASGYVRRGRLPREPEPRDYAQLWIWLCRVKLGEGRAATEELIAFVAARPAAKANDWYSNLAGFLSGRLNEADLLRLAASDDRTKNDQQTCEACFYAAAARALRGDRAGALALFDRCLATKVTAFTEYEDAPAWKSGLLTGARIRPAAPVTGGGAASVAAGMLVSGVEAGGPAAKAGLRPDDVIRVVDDRPATWPAWWRVLTGGRCDDVLRLEVSRGGGLLEIRLRLGRWD